MQQKSFCKNSFSNNIPQEIVIIKEKRIAIFDVEILAPLIGLI